MARDGATWGLQGWREFGEKKRTGSSELECSQGNPRRGWKVTVRSPAWKHRWGPNGESVKSQPGYSPGTQEWKGAGSE